MSRIDPDARAFLESQRSGHLATADASGAPHVIPVVYALLDDAIFIAIDEKPKTTTRLKRVRNIEENPRAALVVDRYDDDWTKLGWVLLRGPASVLEPGSPGTAEAIAALRARYPQYESMALEDRPLIRLDVHRVTTWGKLD